MNCQKPDPLPGIATTLPYPHISEDYFNRSISSCKDISMNFCWNVGIKGGRQKMKKRGTEDQSLLLWKSVAISEKGASPPIDTKFNPPKIPLSSNYGHVLCWGSWAGLVGSILNWNSHLWMKKGYYLLNSFNAQVQNCFLVRERRETMSGVQGNLTSYFETHAYMHFLRSCTIDFIGYF